MVFVIGSPRSGTTFLAAAIGRCPGFVDLGEIHALKAAIPELQKLEIEAATRRVRGLLVVARRLSLVSGLRAVEQTPETGFVARAVQGAMPEGRFVHIVRDGRDVVCSLLEQGWLSAGRGGADDAGLAYGSHRRFWVEPDRHAEFERSSDAKRAAWAWRRYVEAARSADDVLELRYERLAADPRATAEELSVAIDTPPAPLAAALENAYASSVGRFRRDLTPDELHEVEGEAGHLLRELGYLQQN